MVPKCGTTIAYYIPCSKGDIFTWGIIFSDKTEKDRVIKRLRDP